MPPETQIDLRSERRSELRSKGTEDNSALESVQRSLGQVHVPPAAQVDFTHRADPAELSEWMDEPCSYEQFRDCIRDLGSVNRWTLAYRPTLQFLDRAVKARGDSTRGLRVLDVGSGGGDTLRCITRWARRRGVALELTGVDLNPHATRAALESSARDCRFAAIRWYTADVYQDATLAGSELVLSSLMTHHMRDPEIVRFLRWMEATATAGWFVSDLLRSPRAYSFFRVLSRAMRWHPFVQHDGPVSIRRAFREEDWRRLLTEAGVPLEAVTLSQPVPGRLCVERLR